MPKGTGQRGHRTKGDSALSRKATQHQDFVGQAEPERDKSREVEQQRIRRDQEELKKETVKQMARELEEVSVVSEPPRKESSGASEPPPTQAAGMAPEPERQRLQFPGSVREGIELIRQRGPQVLDALRAKAEERLVDMPAPVRAAVHLTERAIGLALWPVRTGARLFGRVLETPAALVRILMARRTT